MRTEIGNWHYKTQLGLILTISKNVQDRFHPFISIPATTTAATLTWVETGLPWIIIILFFNQCRYATVSLCRCWSLQMAFPPQLSTFLYSLSQYMPWKCWAGFHPLMIVLVVLANQCLLFFTNGKIYPRLTHTQDNKNYNCEKGND